MGRSVFNDPATQLQRVCMGQMGLESNIRGISTVHCLFLITAAQADFELYLIGVPLVYPKRSPIAS